ncbi:MAG: ATP-binding protein, partial [Armatimonadetes bacterium]|nr:ATP-binding protein [Armatimonadota bacterium]
LGQTRQDLLGQTLWEAFPATVGTAFEQEFHRAVSERTALEFTEFYEPRQAWWDIRVYPTPEGLTVFLRDVTEHHRAEEERRQMQARQRAFLRDVLGSVTEGKLRLCETPDELPPMLTPVGEPVALSRTEGLDTLRHLADEAAVAVGLSEEKRFDLAISVGEAAMNAVVHAGTGTGRVSTSESGTVQVRVEDQGRGIAVENLPKATLERGYTTAGTMGHGMKIMLQALDRLWLLTSPAGTIVVMERDRAEQEPDWLQTVATNSPA